MLSNHIIKSINLKYEVWESPGDRYTAFQYMMSKFMKIQIGTQNSC